MDENPYDPPKTPMHEKPDEADQWPWTPWAKAVIWIVGIVVCGIVMTLLKPVIHQLFGPP